MASTSYVYDPLDEAYHQIRLLTLLPGASGSPIHLTIELVHLIPEHVPEYEALSYFWGSQLYTVNILIDVDSKSYSLAIKQNLAGALQHLRYTDRPRILWIDAISINQEDIPERNFQVRRMADIYTFAKRVVVWLGPQKDDSLLALSVLEKMGSKVEVDWLQGRMIPATQDPAEAHWADPNDDLPLSDHEFVAIGQILRREWFERLWIWQEIQLANESAIILCGRVTIYWTVFRNAIFCLYNKHLPKHHFEKNFQQRLFLVMSLCVIVKGYYFEDLVQMTKNSKCVDHRDRVFALVSFLPPSDGLKNLQPDYGKDVGEVYREVFLQQATACERLHLLRGCGQQTNSAISDMPTWVPNWSTPLLETEMDYLSSSLYSKAVFEVVNQNTLQVSGIIVGTIEIVVQSSYQRGDIHSDIELISQIRSFGSQLKLTATHANGFCKALIAGDYAQRYHPQSIAGPYAPDHEQCVNWISRILSSSDLNDILGALTNNDYKYLKLVKDYIGNRSLCRTIRGNVALAPKDACTGDLVAVILGCNSALTLRSSADNRYQIIGQTYCDGYMEGEAFVGELPSTHRVVWQESKESFYRAYLDTASGNVQVEDPRAGPLPPGWRIVEHDKMYLTQRFANDETGEKTSFDPRLTLDLLKERGVDIQCLNLI